MESNLQRLGSLASRTLWALGIYAEKGGLKHSGPCGLWEFMLRRVVSGIQTSLSQLPRMGSGKLRVLAPAQDTLLGFLGASKGQRHVGQNRLPGCVDSTTCLQQKLSACVIHQLEYPSLSGLLDF